MTGVVLSGIWKSFDDVDVIKGVDLDIQSGEFVVFVGPDWRTLTQAKLRSAAKW